MAGGVGERSCDVKNERPEDTRTTNLGLYMCGGAGDVA